MENFDWYICGRVTPDVYARSGDAEFILDSDFADERGRCASDVEWRECLVPWAAFGFTHTTLEAHLALVPHRDLAYERERLSSIRTWFASTGSVRKALMVSPLLLTVDNGVLRLEDGWHRLGLAVFEHGEHKVPALCAVLNSV